MTLLWWIFDASWMAIAYDSIEFDSYHTKHGPEIQFSFVCGMFIEHGKNILVTKSNTLYDVQRILKSWVS